MCIRRETREKARRSLAFSPVSKPHTHITYMLRQCTSIVYIFEVSTYNISKVKNKFIHSCNFYNVCTCSCYNVMSPSVVEASVLL